MVGDNIFLLNVGKGGDFTKTQRNEKRWAAASQVYKAICGQRRRIKACAGSLFGRAFRRR